MTRIWRVFLPILLVVLAASIIAPPHAQAQTYQKAVSIPVKVILIGLDQVDTNYLSWSYGSSGNLPAQITNQVILGNGTGDIFYPQYTVVKAPASFKVELDAYLRSIERDIEGPDLWFGNFVLDKSNPEYCDWHNFSIPYAVYDAHSVETWLWSHSQELGGFPSNGWTIIVSYLPELPSITWNDVQQFELTKYSFNVSLPTSKPHYYGIVATDPDRGYQLRYRDFMDAWGGLLGRMWFADLSAGPVYNSQWEDIPLQVAIGDNNIDLSSSFGQKWLAEYVSDYVSQATANLIAPDFVYYPVYRPNYQINIFVLDDRDATEKAAVPIRTTVNLPDVQAAFDALVPYSKVTVNLNFVDISQELGTLIQEGYKYTDSWLLGSQFCMPERFGIVDVRPVYDYLLGHMGDYEKNPYLTPTTKTIPVFAFALSGQTYFSYTFKWSLGSGAVEGIALDNTAIISLNQWEFTRGDQVSPRQPGRGVGFTHDIIHETGHEFGLEHPHQFGDIGDFVSSPMGYFTDDIRFGQIDKDAIQRAHVDQIYTATETLMAAMPSDASAQVQAKLAAVDSAYSAMNYTDAMRTVLGAYQLAQQLAILTPIQQPLTLYLTAGLVIGLAAGIGLGITLFRKKEKPRRRRRRT